MNSWAMFFSLFWAVFKESKMWEIFSLMKLLKRGNLRMVNKIFFQERIFVSLHFVRHVSYISQPTAPTLYSFDLDFTTIITVLLKQMSSLSIDSAHYCCFLCFFRKLRKSMAEIPYNWYFRPKSDTVALHHRLLSCLFLTLHCQLAVKTDTLKCLFAALLSSVYTNKGGKLANIEWGFSGSFFFLKSIILC